MEPKDYYDGPSEVNPPPKDLGPCRETAKTRLERVIGTKRRELAALEALAKMVVHVEVGSPLEELVWAMLSRSHQDYL